MRFCRRNLAFAKLAIQTNLEYRLNYVSDAIFQPVLTSLIEITLWLSLFRVAGRTEIGGFSEEYYLSYVLWASFISRITANWMYEFRMQEEIESGSINGLIVRPFTFFEYYLSQFLGYKIITTMVSLLIPFVVVALFDLPIQWQRLPAVFALVCYYLLFTHIISFCIACVAFHLNRVSSLTMAKNLALWLLSGELVPLDLLPEPYKSILINLPFSNAVYIPVGYLTGRFEQGLLLDGFRSISIGILVVAPIAYLMWQKGLKSYVGTGA